MLLEICVYELPDAFSWSLLTLIWWKETLTRDRSRVKARSEPVVSSTDVIWSIWKKNRWKCLRFWTEVETLEKCNGITYIQQDQEDYHTCPGKERLQYNLGKWYSALRLVRGVNGYNFAFLPPATKLRQGNIFTPVCQSFCSRGSATPPEQTPLWANTPQADTPGQTPLLQCMLGYGQQVGGTHPTGMHSCFSNICHGLSLLEMHSGGNDQQCQCRPTSLGILGARWPNTFYYWGGLCSAAPTGGGPCFAVLQPLWVANAMVLN